LLSPLLLSEDISNLPTDLFVDGPIYHLATTHITLAPFYSSWFGYAPSGAIAFTGSNLPLALDTQNLQALVRYLTTFLERAYLRYRTEQQEIVFDVINDITLSLTSTLSLEDIFDKVSNPIRRIVNAESVSIGLYNPSKDELIFVRELLGRSFLNLPTIRLRPGQGIAGWVFENKKPTLVNNVYDDSRFSSEADEQSGFVTHSILCVPLLVEGNAIGILEAVNKHIGRFDDADLDLLQAIANPLAIALENANLHSEVLSEKRRVEMIFNNMSEGMLTTDGNGIITSINDALLSLLQIDSAEVSYKPAQEIIQARRHNLSDFIELVLAAKDDETPNIACEIYAEYPSEAVPVLISGACIHDKKGMLLETIFVFSDLREIREVERMRDDFFHNIVHELRTPLATILMYARLLKKQGISAEKSTRFISTIEHESDRLQTMVRQMLALAKLEAREIQRSQIDINLNHLFAEIIAPLSDAATNKGLNFSSQIEPKLPLLAGNREILYSVFKNLIDNAVKFTQHGTIQVNVWHTDKELHVIISDQGIGIPQEALPNLFRRFYRAQTAVEQGIAGTGLGLYMVKEGVEKHGGQIEISSVVGKGTTFNICLPLST
ncbi:MAG TPA: GAF domain-containing protein, partial [Anaerolineae bacterium]|nr:GAF domain-containing protein [Anaerolineae bacterium]